MNQGATTGTGQLLARLWQHLLPRHRVQFFLLLGLMLANALAEVVPR